MKCIIACAGTGGHINPGIAIANYIREMEPSSEFLFIGTETGMENEIVKKKSDIGLLIVVEKVNGTNKKSLYRSR